MQEDDADKGFFERRPWLGLVLFLAIVVATGLVLLNVLGVRPHYRGGDWRLITDLPPGGTGMEGGSARCLVAEEFQHDPIHVDVLVNVRDAQQRPLGHLQMALATGNGTRLLSYGVTEPAGGSLHLSLPGRFDQDLFRGEVQAVVLLPGASPLAKQVPAPRHGSTSLLFNLDDPGLAVDLAVRRSDGAPFTGEAWVQVRTWFEDAQPLARGYRVLGGETRIGGLPRDVDLRFSVTAPGHPESVQRLRFPTAAGNPGKQRLYVGTPGDTSATTRGTFPPCSGPVRVTVQYQDGLPVGDAAVLVLDHVTALPPLAPVPTDQTGAAEVARPAAEGLVVAWTGTHAGWAEKPREPLFVGLKPLGSAVIRLIGRGAEPLSGTLTLRPRGLAAPAAVVKLLAPAPAPLSDLGRARFPGLLPGTWEVLLSGPAAGPGDSRSLGAVRIPGPGAAVEASFDL